MAPKRPPAKAESSSASSSSNASSSDEEREVQEEIDSVSSSKKNLAQKNPTKPINPSPNPPADSSIEEEDGDDEDSGDDKELGGGDNKKQEGSDEEEEEEGSGDEEESDSEDEKTKKNKPPVDPQPKMQHKLVPKPTQEPSGSGSSDGSGSDSDSSEEEALAPAPVSVPRPSRSADPSIKPISSKPMDALPKPTKPAASPAPAPSQDRESLKRKHGELEPEQENNGGLKRQLFQRLWSLEDEIVLLNGLLQYRSKEGALPSTKNMEGFHNFIVGSLQVEVSSSQLVNKLRSLKKKFDTNVARTKNGTDPKFSKDHERDVYELSKKVWGVKKISSEDTDANGGDSEENEESDTDMAIVPKPNEEQLDSSKHEDIVKDNAQYPYLLEAVTKMADQHLCGVAIRRAMTMLNDSKAKLMDEKLKRLKTIELKHHLRRIDLNKETVKLIIDAISRSE